MNTKFEKNSRMPMTYNMKDRILYITVPVIAVLSVLVVTFFMK